MHEVLGRNTSAVSGHARGYRADIDGLRSIAVGGVVLYHAVHALLPSGFVGVDIFFVISGYLIGGIIHADVLDRRFRFREFYARRARRILPALMAVLLIACGIGLFLLSPGELTGLGQQSVAASVGGANMWFWAKTAYFQEKAALIPLLMTWSLGVEEQFYIVFPFVMFGVARLRPGLRVPALAVLTLLSFALSILLTYRFPTSAFYLLPPRAWEMSVGAMLAIRHAQVPPLTGGHATAPRLRPIDLAGVAGLLMLAASLLLFDDHTAFPGFAVLLPVAGTLILIHSADSIVNRRLLASRPLVFVGLVSYSWYLWHWPLMAFVRLSTDYEPSSAVMLGVAAASFGMAILSWRFVETPFRRRVLPSGTVLWRYAVALAVMLTVPASFIASRGWPDRFASVQPVIRAAATPRNPCLRLFGPADAAVPETCAPAGASVALLGDSHAAAIASGLADHLATRGQTLLQLEKAACTPLDGFTRIELTRVPHAGQCGTFLQASIARIVADKAIRSVVLVGYWPAVASDTRYRRYAGGAVGQAVPADLAVREGLARLIDRLRAAGKQVVLVGDVPMFDFDTMQHVLTDAMPLRRAIGRAVDGARHQPADHVIEARLDPAYAPTVRLIRAVAATRPDVRYLDVRQQFCAGGRCLFAQEGEPLFIDGNHLSGRGAGLIRWGGAFR